MKLSRFALLAALAIAACSKDAADDDAETTPTVSPEEYAAKQKAFADSVLNTASSASQVVEKLGKGYAIGSVALRDSLVANVGTAPQCYKRGKELDPYLAGRASFFIFMAVNGSNVIRVQESTWSSQAGSIVDSCLNEAARGWKLGPQLAKTGAYILQVEFK
ncbi:MAG: hypothetical protein K2X99_01360 [Gemmatimonadaceae bacterium]|nr:hypothetical protein [Gemmatimonadaceae bacterium]